MPNERILVVDDEETIREIVCSMLGGAHFQTRQAANGVEALSILESGDEFDLVLSDLMMAEMDGIALLERAKAVSYTHLDVYKRQGVSGADRFLLGHAKLAGGRKSGGHAGENLEVKVNFHGNGSARHGDHAWHGSHAGDFFYVCADLRFFLCDRIFAGQKNCAGWNGQPAERGRRGSGNNCAAVGGKERRGPGSGPVVIAPDKRL